MRGLLGEINVKMAMEGRKDAMWADMDKYPELDGLTIVSLLLQL